MEKLNSTLQKHAYNLPMIHLFIYRQDSTLIAFQIVWTIMWNCLPNGCNWRNSLACWPNHRNKFSIESQENWIAADNENKCKYRYMMAQFVLLWSRVDMKVPKQSSNLFILEGGRRPYRISMFHQQTSLGFKLQGVRLWPTVPLPPTSDAPFLTFSSSPSPLPVFVFPPRDFSPSAVRRLPRRQVRWPGLFCLNLQMKGASELQAFIFLDVRASRRTISRLHVKCWIRTNSMNQAHRKHAKCMLDKNFCKLFSHMCRRSKFEKISAWPWFLLLQFRNVLLRYFLALNFWSLWYKSLHKWSAKDKFIRP